MSDGHQGMRYLSLCALVTAMWGGSHLAAFTFEDIKFWVGEGPHRAALVIDWSDADTHPPLAWGYRFSDTSTSEAMLRAIVGADRRLFARLGSSGPFGTPLYGLGQDRNLAGFALTDGTQFENGIAVTGPSDGVTASDPQDSYAEGWFDAFWALFVSLDDPYDTGQWELGGSGISGRVLTDGDWDGMSFAAAAPTVPRLPTAAVRNAAWLESPSLNQMNTTQPVPEPGHRWWMWALGFTLVASRASRAQALAVALAGGAALVAGDCQASGFATTVVEYIPGTDVAAGFEDPIAALGSPTRFTAPSDPYGGPVTPFNAPFGIGELVSIGFGGSLTLGFDEPLWDRELPEEFGIDFIVYGNSFFFDGDFPNGVVAGISTEPGTMEVSQDGSNWLAVSAMADTAFPTMGFRDVTDAFPVAGGSVPTDFFRPVDPTVDPLGLNMPELIDAYAGSGGGTGVDIATTGLAWIQYVRISNRHDPASLITPEVDAISVVPEPSSLPLWGWIVFVWATRTR